MFDKDKVTELLKSFNVLTGIKVVILDEHFNEILSYPERHCGFCEKVNAHHGEKCRESEKEFCKKARSIMNLYTGRCHANLVESVLPITNEGMVVGYLMFGQLLPKGEKKTHFPQYEKYVSTVVTKTEEEIGACTHVLKGLAYYIMSMHPVFEEKEDMGIKIAEYIKKNISEDLGIDTLCRKFSLSRTKLYSYTEPYMPDGIAKYIKRVRMKKAEEILMDTEVSPEKIARMCGYADSNYFCRDFKKTFGVTPRQYRLTRFMLQK